MDLESLRRDLQDQGLLPNPNPSYQPAEFERVTALLKDRLLRFPVSSQFVQSLADGTRESAELLALIVTYVSSSGRTAHSK
jgi:hypothetical protein